MSTSVSRPASDLGAPVRALGEESGAERPAITVLQLCDYGGSYRGSFVPMLIALTRHCRERGWKVECAFTPIARDREWLADLEAQGATVSFAPSRKPRDLARWLEGRLDAVEGRVILHSHFATFDLPALLAARRRSGVAHVWHVHSALPTDPVTFGKCVIKYGAFARRASRVVCISGAGRSSLRRRGAPMGRTVVVENGIDLERFRPATDAQRATARAELAIAPGRPVLLHFAWDWKVKGGMLFAGALAALRERGCDALGLIVGGGEDAREAGRMLGLGDALRVLEPNDDVRRFYDAADVFAATSPAEGGPPLAMLEALACGTAVVASDIPSHRLSGPAIGAVRHAPPRPDALAEAALELLSRPPDRREADVAEAFEWVRAHRDLHRWTERIGDLYGSLA